MGIFGARAHGQAAPTAAEIASVVPADGALLRDEAELVARASDVALRSRFIAVWPQGYDIPSDPARRVDAVTGAMVREEREEVADLHRRAEAIGRLPQSDLTRVFGARDLPSEAGARFEATVGLAARDLPGFEGPKLAAQRALDQARHVRETLGLDKGDADRFRDVSPLARLVWKHVPDMARRSGVGIRPDEGYGEADAERGNVGLSLHNSGADSRAASRSRAGFSQAANRALDVLVGPEGSGGMVDRLIESSSQRERRLGRPAEPARNVSRDLSAAAFLSGFMGR